jgi:ABC-type lipoprotein export system ATPase subunit
MIRTTILKNVKFPGITGGMNDSDRRRPALKLLDFLGIKDKAKYKPSNLTGGQQQRVAIARALMNDPKLILADEPTGNLDTKTGEDVFNLLMLLSHKFKRTIIMVTHNPELAALSDRAIHIRDDSIELKGNGDSLKPLAISPVQKRGQLHKKHNNSNKNLKQVFLLSFDALKERKARSALTILMVVVGGLMIAINGMSAGQSAFVNKQ